MANSSDTKNDHTTAIVPIETWAYQSPRLRRQGLRLDMGLFAEALIYYDRVLIVPATNIGVARVLTEKPALPVVGSTDEGLLWPGFLEFVSWFASRGLFEELLSLFKDGTVEVYHYAFHTLPILKDDSFMLWNAQDSEEAAGPTFARRVLGHRSLEAIVPKARHRERLHRALDKRVIEVHSLDFDRAVENARKDFGDPEAAAAAVQVLVDDVYDLAGFENPPSIAASVIRRPNGDSTLAFNVNFKQIDEGLKPTMKFEPGTPLCGIAHSNRILWSAAMRSVDLYLPNPVSPLVSRKLKETNDRRAGPKTVVDELKSVVEFPDVQTAVNAGDLSFDQVMLLRRKAASFRRWLQTQADRDRDAIVAYHHEVAKDSGFTTGVRKTLRMFGWLAGPGVGAYLGAAVDNALGPVGAAAGAVVAGAADEAVKYVLDVAGKLDENWRPVVFGDWARGLVEPAETRRGHPVR